ncbi:tRNA (adenosine(37)-N6)-threonylcarbamoyltransferase complex transferase subunit TsaD [Sedimentisphaera salicampi]|uniref:tRNA N6-adenosine threonylcarbamoyltransferase n=1 Tax=Sedimentisphaera salicampi TaxID=1941349 RepID=A0A1W6LL10_9BACT|nr:tRNA (adenosine(37)-N6)-threonylcarbamoyltransferase complex transferase subunit TsaD [Sedimentisphaera salicampi]ARN56433.1 t(6)A37 threonylcarbamoyladenosine biosynthesis protein [Sedimentisphaera salicampi]
MNNQETLILAIETSCDETAAAVLRGEKNVLSSVVSSQVDLHKQYGGVVPEIASRAHIERIYPVVEKAVQDAGIELTDIDAVAVANCPGLSVALIVGVTAAKTLAFMLGIPLISINHIHAHLQSAMIEAEDISLPATALVVSGGHTSIYNCKSALELEPAGSTIDDAAGEAFDKVAQILNLSYPGGPSIQKAAEKGDPKAIQFPRSMLGKDSLDFSFSGIKTAVLYHCKGQNMKGSSRVGRMSEKEIADIAASFQQAVVDVLVKKTMLAAEMQNSGAVLLGGGVAANGPLREQMKQQCDKRNIRLLIAPMKYCTDNAVMIGSLAWHKYNAGLFADLDLEASSSA